MNTIDIMAGDWVHCITDGTHHRIDMFGDDYRSEVSGRPYYITDGKINVLSDIEPIPITAEILENNGFVCSEVFEEWKYEQDGMRMLWKPFPWIHIQTGECDMKFPCMHVHELQHALRLCGIHKNIEL